MRRFMDIGSFTALTSLTLLMLTPTLAHGASLRSTEAQLRAVQESIRADQSRGQFLQRQSTSVESQMQALSYKMAQANSDMRSLRLRMVRLNTNISKTNTQLAVLQKAMAKEQHDITGVLRFSQEHGLVGFMAVLFRVHSFSTFVTRLTMLANVGRAETTLLTRMHGQQATVTSDLKKLQLDHSSLRVSIARIKADQANLQNETTAQATLLSSIQTSRQDLAKVTTNLHSQEQHLNAAIKAIERKLAEGKLTSTQLVALVKSLASIYNVNPALVMAVIRQESGGNAHAVSSAGARGLMQLMPGTAAGLGVKNAFNARENLKGGITYLSALLKEFHGNVALALAAYNAGPAAVKKYGGIPPYQQTQNYVKNILSMMHGGS